MELESKRRVVNTLGEAAFLFRQLLGRSSLGSHQMKTAQSDHDPDESHSLVYLSAQRPRPLKILSHRIRGETMYGNLCRRQRQAYREFLPDCSSGVAGQVRLAVRALSHSPVMVSCCPLRCNACSAATCR